MLFPAGLFPTPTYSPAIDHIITPLPGSAPVVWFSSEETTCPGLHLNPLKYIGLEFAFSVQDRFSLSHLVPTSDHGNTFPHQYHHAKSVAGYGPVEMDQSLDSI